jgi:hypothetical protein
VFRSRSGHQRRASHGITLSETDSAGLTAACIAIAVGAYHAAARAAEQSRQPWLAAIGRFLLGGIARTPVYMPSQPAENRDYA